MIEAWVDGSFLNNRCSWAYLVLENGVFLHEEYGDQIPEEYLIHRNVAGEIFAVCHLIDFCKEAEIQNITINYDYAGLEAWATGAYKTNKELTKYYKDYVNTSGINITWQKIESHTGNKYNEYVDKLAGYAVGKEKTLPSIFNSDILDSEEDVDDTPVDINTIKRVNLREIAQKQLENLPKTITSSNDEAKEDEKNPDVEKIEKLTEGKDSTETKAVEDIKTAQKDKNETETEDFENISDNNISEEKKDNLEQNLTNSTKAQNNEISKSPENDFGQQDSQDSTKVSNNKIYEIAENESFINTEDFIPSFNDPELCKKDEIIHDKGINNPSSEESDKNKQGENKLSEKEIISLAFQFAEVKNYLKAVNTIKPILNSNLPDEVLALYIKSLCHLGEENANHAIDYAKKCLSFKSGAKPILREYCYALFYGKIVPACTNFPLSTDKYLAGKDAAKEILNISKNPKVVNELIFPFLSLAYRVGDRAFLSDIGKIIPPETFSSEPMVICNTRSVSRQVEYLTYIKK